jgi:Zn-dependent M28 family amino/carboxypeptidase
MAPHHRIGSTIGALAFAFAAALAPIAIAQQQKDAAAPATQAKPAEPKPADPKAADAQHGDAKPADAAKPAPVAIDASIRAADPQVQVFNEHITVLASPWMEGRLPGTRGFERASQYMEEHFAAAGLQPAYDEGNGKRSFRQPFELGGSREITDARLELAGDGAPGAFKEGEEFTLTGLGTATAGAGLPLTFVGYGIDDGPDGYHTFDEKSDLSGQVAVVFRFEPMDKEGRSKWAQRGWSGRSSFASKLTSVARRKPVAIVVVNPPGASDPRAKNLLREGQKLVDVPVYMMNAEAADRLFKAADAQGRDGMALRAVVDEAGAVVPLPKATVSFGGKIESKPVKTANVIGLLPGKGALKDEYIVVGGHLDHLGQGYFGSREGPGKLHPGADDNASGSAGVIMLAKSLADAYKALPADASARSILFMGFAAEESGLNGSEHYVSHPIVPLDKTVLMMNYDMIGRIKNKRLSVSGTGTGEGMQEWLKPYFAREKCGLEVVENPGTGGGGSDHTSFAMKGVPVLFGIIADFHDDYHTSRDTQDKINREDAVLAIRLWHDIALGAATRPERFAFKASERGGARTAKVRFGVRSEEATGGGLRVLEVTPGSSAEEAGIKVDDVMIKFNKLPLKDRSELLDRLLDLNPGDTIQVVVRRDGHEETVYVKMKERK